MAAQHAPPPPTTTTTTTKVVGDYELLSKLGCGSYASVYRSVNLKTGESYAIKAISKGWCCVEKGNGLSVFR
jgi:hypothetical protein